MNFIYPDILLNLIWALPLYFILSLLAAKKRKKTLELLIGKRREEQCIDLSYSKRVVRHILIAIVIIFSILALARPYWGYEIIPYSASGRDILFIVDVSRSMLSRDIAPTRLDHVKKIIKDIIKNSDGNRYGIIAFEGTAFLESPVTEDKTGLYEIVNELSPASIPVGGTNIEKVLTLAIKTLKETQSKYKGLVLFTDGDQIQGNCENVIDELKELKVPLIAVGIGNPETPTAIQIQDEKGNVSYVRDASGEIVKTKLNENLLKNLALDTNGLYIRSTLTSPGTKEIENKIKSLIPEKYSGNTSTKPIEKFQIPLLIAILAFFLWFIIGERRRVK